MPGESTSQRLGSRYWRLWSAAAISSLGDGMVFVAFPLLAASITDDARLVAGVAVAQRVPWLFAILTGALADRLDRRRLTAAIELCRAVVLTALGVTLLLSGSALPALYAAAFLLGMFETAFLGCATANLPSVVSPDRLGTANGYLYAVTMLGESLLGPALGAVAFSVATSLPFVVDAATFVASAVLLWTALPTGRPERAESTVVADVIEGLQWFRRDRLTSALAALIASLAGCQAMVYAVLVLWAKDIVGLSASGYGLFLAVAALGHIVGALVAGPLTKRHDPRKLIVGAGVAAALAYPLLGASTSVVIAGAVFTLEMAAVSIGNVASETLRQQWIPAHLLGRVGNAMRTCIFGAMPVGAAVGGLVANAFGLRTTFVIAGVVQLAVIVYTGRVVLDRRHLRVVPAPVPEQLRAAS